MKTLSVRQPWAYLICLDLKNVENRTWRTHYRGKILIHAPIKSDGKGINVLSYGQTYLVMKRTWGVGKKAVIHKSAIIGSVEIIDCINDSKSIWAEPDQWHWILSNPVLFDKPILNVPGKLGLWNYEGDIN